ncbi:cysteine hydrolase [Pseudoxanthomonas sp.]|uniref:cysteine hydrolase n=1 Tax=Pseudoxanthomonas sp. TaxID=1871049 RepID=UPI003F7CEA3E
MIPIPLHSLLGAMVLGAALTTATAPAMAGNRDAGIDALRQQHRAGRAAVLLIEFQNEWLAPDGKLNGLVQDRAQLADAVAAGTRLLDAARASGVPVIHSGLRFDPGHPELGGARYGLREAIPRAGTFRGAGAEFFGPFQPAPGEFVASGRLGASAFAGSNLNSYLRNRGIDTLLIAGFALHVCVESTLRAAHDLGYETILVEDASAAFNAAQRRHVLDEVVHHFGHAMSSGEVIHVLTETNE